MDPDHGLEDEGPFFAWLPPEDRLWRHPSEVPASSARATDAGRAADSGSGSSTLLAHATKTWTVAVVAGVIGAVAASALGILSGTFENRTTVIHSANANSPAVSLAFAEGTSVDWVSVDDRVAPSVVSVSVEGPSGPTTGSGVLLMQQGNQAYVVTDRSLIAGGSESGYVGPITVTFLAGGEVRGTLIGQDPLSGVAVIAVPNLQATFPTIGSVANLQLADPVLAMAARNSPSGSVFPGFVSGNDREVDLVAGTDMENLIAVSSTAPAPVAGGPLVDRNGNVVGITLNLAPADVSMQNITYAIPMDEVQQVAAELIAGEKLSHPWIGVADSADLSSGMAEKLHLAGGAQAGLIAPGSPASRLGLNPNDIIIGVNGTPVTSAGSLTALLAKCHPGVTATISFIHEGRSTAATILVTNQPYNG